MIPTPSDQARSLLGPAVDPGVPLTRKGLWPFLPHAPWLRRRYLRMAYELIHLEVV